MGNQNIRRQAITQNKRLCHAKKGDWVANQVCKSVGGKYVSDSTGCTIGTCSIYEL